MKKNKKQKWVEDDNLQYTNSAGEDVWVKKERKRKKPKKFKYKDE
tara:strand:- start:1236 stop:1370 length:135 start_codon:yes stop_codon:yes gene_type:complete